MILSVSTKDNICTIALTGSLEISQQAKLKEALASQIPSSCHQVILDFGAVDFIDSACLGSLISLTRGFREKKGDVRLCHLKEEVRSIFQITRLDKVFKFFDSIEAAIRSFA